MIILQQSLASQNAYSIQQETKALAEYTHSALLRIHALANTPGQEQEILDCFGSNAATALAAYSAFANAMNLVKPDSIPLPNQEVFQIQQDGTVVYVAPPTVPLPQA
jgi:hypothetical protein